MISFQRIYPILEIFGYKLELKKIDEEPAKEHDALLYMGGSLKQRLTA